MLTVVVCCDPDWRNWASLVRTRALDLYHPDQRIEFWDCVNNPGPDANLWGNWPRYFSSGGPAVIADLDEQTSRLAHGKSLAVLFVYGTPDALETPTDTMERRAPLSVANLRTLQQRVARLASQQQSNPVMRVGLFRCDGTPAMAAKAAALVADRLFDTVFFIGLHAPAAVSRARQFDAIRLVADIARDVDVQGTERFHWPLLRYQPIDDQVVVYWLHPPQPPRLTAPNALPGLANPSAMSAAAIVAYFDQQTREGGLDQTGQTMKDFTELEAVIAEQVGVADSLGTLRARSLDANREAEAAHDLFGNRWRPPPPPAQPHLAAVRKWQAELENQLNFFIGQRRDRIRERQQSDDPQYRRLEISATRAQALIHAVSTGLTGNAYGRVQDILQDLQRQRSRFVEIASEARARIADITEEERGAAPDAATADHKPIEWFRRFKQYYADCNEFLTATANCLNLRWMSRTALAITLVLYLLLAIHTYAVTGGEVSSIRLLLLGCWVPNPEWIKPAVFGATTALLFCACHAVKRAAILHWEVKRNAIEGCAEEIAKIVSCIDFYTIRHADATAVMSWLTRIERRLSAVAKNIAENNLEVTISQLRDAGADMAIGENEQRAFENALGSQLQRAPMERWLKIILRAAPTHTTLQIHFDSPGGWTGELAIRSQLQPDPGLRVRIQSLTQSRPQPTCIGSKDATWAS
ncbi:MAG: hypothetical protein ABSC06_05635 [Rhodopila sp.]|jgi:hypothetical protein